MFFCEYSKVFKNRFFDRTPLVTASITHYDKIIWDFYVMSLLVTFRKKRCFNLTRLELQAVISYIFSKKLEKK